MMWWQLNVEPKKFQKNLSGIHILFHKHASFGLAFGGASFIGSNGVIVAHFFRGYSKVE